MVKVCFQETLELLRESSREAVANAVCESFSDARSFLHLERDLESELETIVESAGNSPIGQLVLVCGNVGDGKSHLISALLQRHPEYRKQFHIHNDATESSSPTSTNIDELRTNLAPFSDAKLSRSRERIILAINLGTLNNFIVADANNEFSELAAFVRDKQILELGQLQENGFDDNSSFQFINFSDHNLFSLTPDGPVSDIIETALDRVASQAHYDSPFSTAYKTCCSDCPAQCPIKLNYELLSNVGIRKRISALLIQCIVKHHQIISVRALYNFVFDLIVPVALDGLTTREIANWGKKSSSDDYLQNLFPNYLFEHPEVSPVFEHLHYLDPSLRRSAYLDDRIISLITREEPAELLAELEAPTVLSEALAEHATSNGSSHDTLVKTYVRLLSFLATDGEQTNFNDARYLEFMRLLHAWHTGDHTKIKHLYRLIQRAAMAWSGRAPDGEMLLELGNRQLTYRLSEKVSIKPCQLPAENNKTDEVIKKFTCMLPLKFTTSSDTSQQLSLSVDSRLYEMACKVDAGYRVNEADKGNFISFTSFVDDVMQAGELGSRLRITEAETGKHSILELDEFGDFTFRGEN